MSNAFLFESAVEAHVLSADWLLSIWQDEMLQNTQGSFSLETGAGSWLCRYIVYWQWGWPSAIVSRNIKNNLRTFVQSREMKRGMGEGHKPSPIMM